MTWPTPSFSNLASPVAVGLLDGMFTALGNIARLPCSATGGSSIVLTPRNNVPVPTALSQGVSVSWQQGGNSSGPCSITLASFPTKSLVFNDLTTVITDQLQGGQTYCAYYDQIEDVWCMLGVNWCPPGTSGQFLTYSASGMPSYQTFSGGGVALLNTLTAASVAIVSDITSLTGTYTSYLIHIESFIPVSASFLRFRVHSGGAFQATSYNATTWGGNVTAITAGVAETTYIPLSRNNTSLPNQNPGGVGGFIFIDNPAGTAYPKQVKGVTGGYVTLGGGAPSQLLQISGSWNSNNAIDGFSLDFSTGNILSGKVRIYGVA